MEVRWQRHAAAALLPENRSGTHYIGGWVGHSACLENLASTGIQTPECPALGESP
jgi:hypothetical protein